MARDVRTMIGDTIAATEEYFNKFMFEMRFMGSVTPDLTMELYGRTFSTPVMTAALSHLKGKDGDGMVQMAQGAKDAGAAVVMGMSTCEQFAEIAKTGASLIRIIKPYADENEIYSRIEQAEEAGALAVGMDIGHAFNFTGGPDNVLGNPMTPKTFSDMERYCKRTSLPFVVKDVLSAEDARKCVEAGAGGLIISHHNGILPNAMPPLMVLPEILDVVKGRVPVFIDCCFTNGIDVLKALAMGVKAVCVGRVLIPEIQEKGAKGAQETIERITAELRGAMAKTGSRDLASIDPKILRKVG